MPRPTSDISVLLGAGDGTFSAAVHYFQSQPSKALLSGDFDGDGDLDIVATNSGQNWDGQSVALHRNRGDGTSRRL